MRALMKLGQWQEKGNVELCDAKRPKPGADEVLVRVMAAGICGTDVKIWHGAAWSNPPVILGHEYSGVIEEVGKDVKNLKPGDRVVSETGQVVCGVCEYCKTGRELMCDKRLSIGYGVNGAMAEYIKVRQAIVHKIPDTLSFDKAALCEPFAVALHALWDHTNLTAADKVLIMGPGAIGQLAAQAAKSVGATVVLAGLPQDKERLDAAKKAGVDITLTELSEEAAEKITGEKGFDVVLDCSGAEPAIRRAMKTVKKTGTFIQVGLTKPEMTIDYSLLTGKEIQIIGTFGHRWHNWETAIELMDTGKVNVEHLITAGYELEDWKKGFTDMQDSRGIKILIYPNGKEGGSKN